MWGGHPPHRCLPASPAVACHLSTSRRVPPRTHGSAPAQSKKSARGGGGTRTAGRGGGVLRLKGAATVRCARGGSGPPEEPVGCRPSQAEDSWRPRTCGLRHTQKMPCPATAGHHQQGQALPPTSHLDIGCAAAADGCKGEDVIVVVGDIGSIPVACSVGGGVGWVGMGWDGEVWGGVGGRARV